MQKKKARGRMERRVDQLGGKSERKSFYLISVTEFSKQKHNSMPDKNTYKNTYVDADDKAPWKKGYAPSCPHSVIPLQLNSRSLLVLANGNRPIHRIPHFHIRPDRIRH